MGPLPKKILLGISSIPTILFISIEYKGYHITAVDKIKKNIKQRTPPKGTAIPNVIIN